MAQLIVGFYESIFNSDSNNEFLNYIVGNGFIGIDIQRITGDETLYGGKSFSLEAMKHINELYDINRLIHDDIKNIKKYFETPTFSYIRSTMCVGIYTTAIDGLVDLILKKGRMDIYGVYEQQLPIIIEKAAGHFSRTEITYLNSYKDDPEASTKMDFAVNLIDKITY